MTQDNRWHLITNENREKLFHKISLIASTTYACFQIHCEPIRYINFLIIFRELGFKVDGSQIRDFHHLEYVINGDIVVGVSRQNVALIVEDDTFFDCCSALDACQFRCFAGAVGGAVVIIVDGTIVVICRRIRHNAETVAILPWQFPAFYI